MLKILELISYNKHDIPVTNQGPWVAFALPTVSEPSYNLLLSDLVLYHHTSKAEKPNAVQLLNQKEEAKTRSS